MTNIKESKCPLKDLPKSNLVDELEDCECALSGKKVKDCEECNGG